MPDRNFGALVKSRRPQVIDETTGRAFTQEGLADAVGRITGDNLTRTWASELEAGRIALPAPRHVNAICSILGIEGAEAFSSLGYEIQVQALRDDERDLLAAYRRLRSMPILQETALRVVQNMSPPPPQSASPGRGRHRRSAE